MTSRSLLRATCALTAALAFVVAGCGDSDDNARSAQPEAAAAAPGDAYRDEVTAIVRVTDDARGEFRAAAAGEPGVSSARQLAEAARAAAGDVGALTPPENLRALNAELAAKYRLWAAALERELLRKPVSMARLADVIRKEGKAADDAYEQILIAP